MKLLRSILSIVLAFLVLLSSTNFMVGIHYCGGKVQNVAVFTPADECDMEKSLPPCHRKMMARTHCCDDEQVIHKADDQKISSAKIQLVIPIAVVANSVEVIVSEIIPSAALSHTQYYNYDPPLRSCDLTLEHQVLLI
jgi:hypothetical protein